MEIHHAAREGFGSSADAYARGRPDYPEELQEWLAGIVGTERRVAEIGAGTGKFTRRLLDTGAAVVAVEPVEAMRRQLKAQYPDVPVVDAVAADLPFDDASLDAVCCAQSFHWFATAETLCEFGRVLKPGGSLLLVWNTRDDTVPWVRALGEIVNAHAGDAPRFASGAWRAPFPAKGFGPLQETRFPHAHAGPVEEVVIDRFLSVSYIAALPAPERERVAERLRAAVAAVPNLAGQDKIAVPYVTSAFRCRRL
ncbi:class I SAM-dependent methyltransferase [Aureimonas phyllosphaerae]|uniref:class I SAM-dependent methyltransferase n=1 Tax=Aureimonas phyllosphaerae TaxID=1166078 RepID=UPI003A5C640D